MTKKQKNKNNGSALVFVLIIAMVLALTGMSLLKVGVNNRLLTIHNARQVKARSAAECGQTKALWGMNEKLKNYPWSDSWLPSGTDVALEGTDETFSYKVAGDKVNGYRVKSVGNSGNIQRSIESTLGLNGLFEYAILTKELLDLKSGTVVDWYNYDSDDGPLKIGTKSTGKGQVVLHSGNIVKGHLTIGVDGDTTNVINDTGADVKGDTYAVTEDIPIPMMTVPAWLASQTFKPDVTGTTTLTTSGKYKNIWLKNSDILTIDGPVTLYITDSMILGNGAQLQILDTNPNASLTIYMDGDLTTDYGGFINNLTKNSQKLTIYGLAGCGKIEFKTDCDFYGVMYAPETDIIMRSSVNIYGAVTGKSFRQFAAANLYYDASLRIVDVYSAGVRFKVQRWYE
ncbi:MAG: DUF7305 domain-containing protein [Planctomycetota bacterium]|jgi:hypothetical protein